jgi:hypothetical protein
MPTCPRCGGHDLHHSRLRSWVEGLRLYMTRRAPFRCHTCDWRGWRRDDVRRSALGIRQIHHDLTEAELERLDPD